MALTSKTKSVLAGALIATVTTFGMLQPANAGGSLSFSIRPSNYEEDIALRTAFHIYSLVKGHKSNGNIRQKGSNNRAGVRQNGRGNRGVIYQEGNGHSGNLNQQGNNNNYGIFQFGKRTNANVVQRGHGQTGAAFLFGW